MTRPDLYLRFPARAAALRPLRALVAEHLGSQGVGEAVCRDLLLALQEALTNIVRHAYGGREGTVTLSVRVEGESVRLEITDRGGPFDPTRVPPPDLQEARTGGYGVYLIRRLVDDVRYRRRDGRNVLCLTRRLPVPS